MDQHQDQHPARVGQIDTFAAIARSLGEQDGLEATLQRIVDLAVDTVPAAEYAAVSLARARRQVETVAATAEVANRVDLVQYETGQGPCLDSIYQQDVVEVQDLAQTVRWPEFAYRAADLGIASMLSFRPTCAGPSTRGRSSVRPRASSWRSTS